MYFFKTLCPKNGGLNVLLEYLYNSNWLPVIISQWLKYLTVLCSADNEIKSALEFCLYLLNHFNLNTSFSGQNSMCKKESTTSFPSTFYATFKLMI